MRWFCRLLVAVLLLLFAQTGSHHFRSIRSRYILSAQDEAAPVHSRTSQANSPETTTAGATSSTGGIAGIHVVGQPTLVFDHLVDKNEPNHIPDLPATAWKEANGSVNVTVPHFENYRLRGPDLEHVVSSPNPIFSSRARASDIVESHYDYHHWLAAPYTFDGLAIYALAHTEWYACLLLGDCSGRTAPTATSTGSYLLNSWANTVTSLVSTDGGASWATNGLNEAHVVSNESFTWTGSVPLAQAMYRKALNHSGMMTPTRIIKEGSYYYSMAFLNHRDFSRIDPSTSQAPIDKYDWVLMRTIDPRQAAGWEGWVSGSQFVPLSSHGFRAFSPRSAGGDLNAGEPQIIFDTNANVYIVIFVIWGAPGSIYYVTTPTLANPVWSDAVAIGGSASLQTDPRSANPAAACSTGFQVNNYVSFMDTHSDGLNFEFTDGDPWLFYVFNPANNCGGDNLARDLYRLKLNVDYAAGPRPAFTAQPVDKQVIAGQNTQLTVTTSGALTYRWQMSTNAGVSWTSLTDVPPYSGALTATLTVTAATPGLNGYQFRAVATNTVGSAISSAAVLTVRSKVITDMDGDVKAEIAVFRPSNGTWYIRYSSLGYSIPTAGALQWGLPGDVPISGDFDGDGKTELAIFRPSNGTWYIRYSSLGYSVANAAVFQWGLPGDIPATGDFDGDGNTEVAVFRPSNGTWYIRYSSLGYSSAGAEVFQWGLPGDLPITGDFDGDGKTELAVFRPWNATWYIRYSTSGYSTASAGVFQWGLPADLPMIGDFDGDGKTELAVFRPSNGTWYIRYSTFGYSVASAGVFQWGLQGDVPTAADFDGDGKSELTVFRPATGEWFIRYSSLGYSVGSYAVYQWGLPGDTVIE